MFVHYNNKMVNADSISWIDYKNLKSLGYIRIHFKDGVVETLEGTQAIQLLMELDPSALEGERFKYARHAWAIHNLIGHPLMQACAWLQWHRLGLWFHDITIPTPITKDR